MLLWFCERKTSKNDENCKKQTNNLTQIFKYVIIYGIQEKKVEFLESRRVVALFRVDVKGKVVFAPGVCHNRNVTFKESEVKRFEENKQ